ncbi:INT5 protein, partial [Malurus elegans]|nr:INT5 protein [Malurus elegans]
AVLAQLVEGALRGPNAELFGGWPEEPRGQHEDPAAPAALGVRSSSSSSLLDTNRRFTAGPNASGGVWSVFHAGVIGRGPKVTTGLKPRAPDEPNRNIQALLSLLLRCCRSARPCRPCPRPCPCPGPPVGAEAAKAVAAALVEAVCPEAAGAELAWPPEELARATVERDLRILRRFQ